MNTLTLLLITPLVLVAEAAILSYVWVHPDGGNASGQGINTVLRTLYRNPFGIAALVVAWLLLTAVAFIYEFFVALIVLYGLLFTGGHVAGWVGLVFFGALFVSTPGICGWLVLRFGRNFRSSGEPGPRQPGRVGIERTGQAMPSP